MKILLANPNTSQTVTDRIAATARAAASPGTHLHAVTAPIGVPYMAGRAEATIGAFALLGLLAEHAATADAVIVAAFGDPGVDAARELLAIPVVGLAEAAMLTACMLGRRFAIVTFASPLGAWYQEIVDHVGLARRCTGIHFLDEPFDDIATVAEQQTARLTALCHTAIAAGAEVCILAGAPLAGLAETIADTVPVPLIDGVAAAVRQAETLVALHPRKPLIGSFRYPAAKPMSGLPDAVVQLFRGGPERAAQSHVPP